MTLPTPVTSDALRPTPAAALAAWAARVADERTQTDRCRELADPADFYAPTAHRFRFDPGAEPDAVGRVLLDLARSDETWLDVGAGGGRYALPLAREVRGVIAVEPSPAMLDLLRAGMVEAALDNLEVVAGRWPLESAGQPAAGPSTGASTGASALPGIHADVGLVAHVGYDIEAMGSFLDALEDAVGRMCIAVMGEGAMTTVGRRYWTPIHGEQRVALPALPELLTLLIARGRLPQVQLVEREVPTYPTFEALHDRARRQLWLRPGSERDVLLGRLLRTEVVTRDDSWVLPEDRARIGIVTWSPRD